MATTFKELFGVNPKLGFHEYDKLELAEIMVGLADKFVEDPWQKLWLPENETTGVSYTFTIYITGVAVAPALAAVQTNV